jgi:hypothetical protein
MIFFLIPKIILSILRCDMDHHDSDIEIHAVLLL